MSEDELTLSAILEEAQEAFEKAETDRWAPPIMANYNCTVAGVRFGATKTKDGHNALWFNPDYLILDGEFEESIMQGDYCCFTKDPSRGQQFNVQKAKTFIKIVNNGICPKSAADAFEVAKNAAGTAMVVAVKESFGKAKKPGEDKPRYVNVSPSSLI